MTAFIGASLVLTLPERLLSQAVGVILIAYVVYLLLKPAFRLKKSPLATAAGGAGSGFLGGLTGVGGGALRAIVLTAFNVPKSTYIFTSGLLGAVIDASRITTYFVGGIKIIPPLAWGLTAFIPASLAGAWVAKRVVDKIPQEVFRGLISIFLFILGVKFFFFP